jgi:hypothetical protein
MTRWKPRRLLLAGTLCVFPLAAPAAVLAVPVSVVPLCAVMFVSGAAIEVFGVSWMTALDRLIPTGSTVGMGLSFSRPRLHPDQGVALLGLAGPGMASVARPGAFGGS